MRSWRTDAGEFLVEGPPTATAVPGGRPILMADDVPLPAARTYYLIEAGTLKGTYGYRDFSLDDDLWGQAHLVADETLVEYNTTYHDHPEYGSAIRNTAGPVLTGLTELPPADPAFRAWVQVALAGGGWSLLAAACGFRVRCVGPGRSRWWWLVVARCRSRIPRSVRGSRSRLPVVAGRCFAAARRPRVPRLGPDRTRRLNEASRRLGPGGGGVSCRGGGACVWWRRRPRRRSR